MWGIGEAQRILRGLLMICAASYVYGRMLALWRQYWQPAAAVEPVETVEIEEAVTEKDVTEGDAPEDVGAASNARRDTVCVHICMKRMHTHSLSLEALTAYHYSD
jgi:hypothetical protein